MKFCPECGSQLPLGPAKFCPNCGKSLWDVTDSDIFAPYSLGIKLEQMVEQILKIKDSQLKEE